MQDDIILTDVVIYTVLQIQIFTKVLILQIFICNYTCKTSLWFPWDHLYIFAGWGFTVYHCPFPCKKDLLLTFDLVIYALRTQMQQSACLYW